MRRRCRSSETSVFRRIPHEEIIGDPEDHEHYCRDKEDLSDAEVVDDLVAQIEGEIDPERDQDPEDRTKHAASHVEPRRVTLHDGCGAPKLWKYMFTP